MDKIVLFDFDGVLVDDFEMCFDIIRNKIGIKLKRKQYRDMFTGNIYKSWRKIISEEEYQKGQKKYAKLYSSEILKQPLISGMPLIIRKLASKYKLIIISSSPTNAISSYLQKNDIHSYFNTILGQDINESKSEKIDMVFQKYKIAPQESILITDTVGDVKEANNKKVKSIVVTWGFHQKEYFNETPPFAFVDGSKELVSLIDNYFST